MLVLMHSTDTKSQFIELRAKGWSLARIAAHLKISTRTLVDWNRQAKDEIRVLRALELEALQEKILATHEQELTRLAEHLQRLEQETARRDLKFVETENLYRLSSMVRAEIRRVRLTPQVDDAPPRAASLDPKG